MVIKEKKDLLVLLVTKDHKDREVHMEKTVTKDLKELLVTKD